MGDNVIHLVKHDGLSLAENLRSLADSVEGTGASSAIVVLDGMQPHKEDVVFLGRAMRLSTAIGLLILAISTLEHMVRSEST